ncbi:MAG: hypothetical protein HY811_06440 [Planctomycetes bacterium]|nr:hypothetical protein [Planctomycetota bacterium]
MESVLSFLALYPFWSTVVISLVIFALAHIILAKIYRAGLKPTIIAGLACGLIVIGLLHYGVITDNQFFANLMGVFAGIVMWSLFGEIMETLQGKFNITTHVEIGYGHLPFLILGSLIWGLIIHTEAIENPVIFQFLFTVYAIWLGHVILLSLYYHPWLGEPLKSPEVKASKLKVTLTILTLLVYAIILIIMALKAPDYSIKTQVSTALWFVLLAWSFIEVAKKYFSLKLW